MNDSTTYLGDGVYASHDGVYVAIWTSDGVRQSEKIFLDLSVLAALHQFVRSAQDQARQRPLRTQSVYDAEAGVHRTLVDGEQ